MVDRALVESECQIVRFTGGGAHVPSATSFFGALSCSASLKPASLGAGSQLLSLSLPGESLWMYSVDRPRRRTSSDCGRRARSG